MAFLGVPPGDLDLECDLDGIAVSCVHSSAGVSTSISVRDGSETAIIDAGDGTLRDLIDVARVRIPGTFDDAAKEEMARIVEGIRFVALSHDHFDHAGGLLSLLCFLGMVGRRSKLKVLGPDGSGMAESMVRLFQGYIGAGSYAVEFVPMMDQGALEIDGWSIEWIQARHAEVTIDGTVGEVVPAICMTVSRKGRRIFYSGDTALFDGMLHAAEGCDLAIAEGTYPESGGRPAHMSIAEATKVVSGAKRGWIVHLTGASKAFLDGRRSRK